MANDTQSSHRMKLDESKLEKRASGGRTPSSSCPSSTDTLDLRRSSHETLSKKQVTSTPSSRHKHEQFEKRMPLTSLVKKKSDRNEKPGMQSPLRRSDRGKKYDTSSSSGLNKSEKLSSSLIVKPWKEKKDKSVEQLTEETREVIRSEERGMEPIVTKKKTMTARNYKALLKQRRSAIRDDDCNELERPYKLLQADHSSKGGNVPKKKVDVDDEVHEHGGKMGVESGREYLERLSERVLVRSQSVSKNSKNSDAEISRMEIERKLSNSDQKREISEKSHECSDIKTYCTRTGTLASSKLLEATSTGRTHCSYRYMESESGNKSFPSKRKRRKTDDDLVAREDICTSIEDDVSSQPSRYKKPEFLRVCVACAKSRRIGVDAAKQQLCSCKTKSNNGFSKTTTSKSHDGSSAELFELPTTVSPGTDVNMLNIVNKLRDCWHKHQHAIIFDEQERIMKAVLFILSLCDTYQPFLIITTSDALYNWETEFMRLAPSIDVVVYNGNRDNRKYLRALECQEKGGCITFQVLLLSVETVIEDLEILGTLKWEAVMIDECQLARIFSHLKQIKMLMTNFRMLLFNGQMMETVADHLNLLSLLDSDNDFHSSGGLPSDVNGLGELKERLSRFIIYSSNSNLSRFLEYWVPVQISDVQLEQYCATLLSNSISLCSSLKNDPVGALRDIVISTQKCCDHPYIVDPSLQALITKGLPLVDYLDVEVNASGKLQLLDKMLSEIKNRQLRVLILFQSMSGSGRSSIGNILDDFLRQRFGPDSYERVDGGVIPSRKQAALNKFNKDSGRFVFLLESRACLPSIKLSSVDTVIIFGSDWNPVNDLKALHKISIESQFRQIIVFRFYTAFTIEEKLLILAKKLLTLDSNLHNISRSLSDTLLMWGASSLFSILDEFHSTDILDSLVNTRSERSLLNDVVKEFLGILSPIGKNNDACCLVISKVHHDLGAYTTNLPLAGELKIQLKE